MVSLDKKANLVSLVGMVHPDYKDLKVPLVVDKDLLDLLDLKDLEASVGHLDLRDWMDLTAILDPEDHLVRRVAPEYLENLDQKVCLVKKDKKELMVKSVYLVQLDREV